MIECAKMYTFHTFHTFQHIFVQVHAAKGLCVMGACFLHDKRSNFVVRRGVLNFGAGFAKLYCLEDEDGVVLRDCNATL